MRHPNHTQERLLVVLCLPAINKLLSYFFDKIELPLKQYLIMSQTLLRSQDLLRFTFRTTIGVAGGNRNSPCIGSQRNPHGVCYHTCIRSRNERKLGWGMVHEVLEYGVGFQLSKYYFIRVFITEVSPFVERCWYHCCAIMPWNRNPKP